MTIVWVMWKSCHSYMYTHTEAEDKVRDEFESIKALLDSEIKDVLERSED